MQPSCGSKTRQRLAWVVGIVVCGLVVDFPEQPLHAAAHGVRVVDVDVVVLRVGRLLHKRLADLRACRWSLSW